MDEYQEPSTATTDQLNCQICDTEFTTPQHKERHMGTKKHKRNLRLARRRAVYENSANTLPNKRDRDEDNSESIPQVSIFERCDYRGTREHYSQKKGKPYAQDSHTSYVSSVIAYWSVKLMLNPTIENFHIALNDKSWGSFGDAVVEIRFKALPQKASFQVRQAVNFRTIGSSNTKTVNSFENGTFSFQDISDKITEIQNERQELDAETKFLVFTTTASSLDAPLKLTYRQKDKQIVVIAKNYSNETYLCLNTAEDNECIYRFFPQNNYYQLPNVCVYAGQKQKKELPNAIRDLIANEFGERRMEIANDFIKYITNWTKLTRAGAFKLSKEDVMVKLGQLLLTPFQISPTVKTVQGPIDRFTRWIEVIRSIDVTILKPSVDLSELFEPFDLLIETVFGEKIDIVQNVIRTNKSTCVTNINNPILLSYILHEIAWAELRNSDIILSLKDIYLFMWMAGLMPLMLELENPIHQEYVLNILNKLRKLGYKRQYILIANDVKTKSYQLSFASNLGDIIANMNLEVLKDINLHVTEEFSIELGTIQQSDQLFAKSISPREFFYMTLGKSLLKPHCSSGEHTKIVLPEDLMNALDYHLESKRETQGIRTVLANSNTHGSETHWLRGINPEMFQ